MACLTDSDGAMVTELARYAMIEQSRLTKIIIQMDARGLVKRRSDPKDGRRVRVFLTAKGRQLAHQLVADARAHELELLRSFRGGEGAEIKDTLRALIQHLDSDTSDQRPENETKPNPLKRCIYDIACFYMIMHVSALTVSKRTSGHHSPGGNA